MQAIQTKVLCPTNTKGTRIKATCCRGSLTISAPDNWSVSDERAHAYAAKQLVGKFIEQDAKEYGTPRNENPWGRHFSTGCLPDGSFAHVFID